MNIYDVDPFTRAYAECALWASVDDQGIELDSTYDSEQYSEETLKEMIEDCQKFQKENAADLEEAYSLYKPSGDGSKPEQQAGHDFYLSRHHHGAGFWDRGLGEVGKRLTEAAQKFPERNLWVQDNKIYQE